MTTLGMALNSAMDARTRHVMYSDGPRFLDRRDRGGSFVHSDPAITQMASAVAPCSMNLTREAAKSHILHATFVANHEYGARR